jgi:hypothetical protein
MSSNSLYGIPERRRPRPSPEVVRWRMRRLTDAGFDASLAAGLAVDGDVDLHALLNLVDRGCPPHLAARIMGSRAADVGVGSHG